MLWELLCGGRMGIAFSPSNGGVTTPLGHEILYGMPYSDPEKQREYKREWQRARRERTRQDPDERSGTQLQSPDDVLTVLEEQVDMLRRDSRLRSTDRAKAIAQLAALSLKVLESRDIERGHRVGHSNARAKDAARSEPSGMTGRRAVNRLYDELSPAEAYGAVLFAVAQDDRKTAGEVISAMPSYDVARSSRIGTKGSQPWFGSSIGRCGFRSPLAKPLV